MKRSCQFLVLLLTLIAPIVVGMWPAPAAPPGGNAPRYTIAALDTRPGYQWSRANAMNENGLIVGHLEDADRHTDAVAWQVTLAANAVNVAQVFLPLPADTTVIDSAAWGVDDSGRVVGMIGYVPADSVDSVQAGAYWHSSSAAPTELPALPGHGHSWAMSINNAGLIVGMSGTDVGEESRTPVAWRVNAAGTLVAGPIDLGILAGTTFGETACVSNADANGIACVVGNCSDGMSVLRAVLWEIDIDTLEIVAGPVALGNLPNGWPLTKGTGINDAGTACGKATNAYAFRKPYGAPAQQLPEYKPGQVYAYAINNRGEIVGKNDHYDRRTHIFQGTYGVQWRADGKIVNLDTYIGTSGWYHIHNGMALNELGWIAGHGAIEVPGEYRALVMIPR